MDQPRPLSRFLSQSSALLSRRDKLLKILRKSKLVPRARTYSTRRLIDSQPSTKLILTLLTIQARKITMVTPGNPNISLRDRLTPSSELSLTESPCSTEMFPNRLSRTQPVLRIPLQASMCPPTTRWVETSRHAVVAKTNNPLATFTSRASVSLTNTSLLKILTKVSHSLHISQLRAVISSKAFQRRSDTILAPAHICTTSLWKIKCEPLATRSANVTKWIHLELETPALNTRSSPRKMSFQRIWTTEWSLSKTRM